MNPDRLLNFRKEIGGGFHHIGLVHKIRLCLKNPCTLGPGQFAPLPSLPFLMTLEWHTDADLGIDDLCELFHCIRVLRGVVGISKGARYVSRTNNQTERNITYARPIGNK